MGFLEKLKDAASTLADKVKQLQNKDFMTAVTAGCALIATADGQIDASEKLKMVGFIKRNEALKVFPINDVMKSFNKFVEGFELDFDIGKMEALQAIVKLKGNTEASKILVTVCCAIGAADGNFDDDEKACVRSICTELSISASDFGL